MRQTAKIFLGLITAGWLVIGWLPSAQAQETCTCFCQSPGGAVENGTKSVAQCQEECGTDFLVCSSSPQTDPANNQRCFDLSYCEGQDGLWDAQQTPVCMPGFRYCFPKSAINPIGLSVSIGSTTQVTDAGDYISAVYTWLLGAAMTIAIVLVMVGGVQYVLAAGGGKVEEAKTRMANAVIGFVILLSAYVILFTVNPDLLDVTMPKIPMVKTVAFVGEGTGCEVLERNGYTIKYKQGPRGSCGGIGEIVAAPSGVDVVEGATCRYLTCLDKDDRCMLANDKGYCLSCTDLHPNNIYNITPSSNLCASFDRPVQIDKAGNPTQGNRCFYSTDKNVMSLFGIDIQPQNLLTGGSVVTGTCVSLPINCAKIAKCEDYDDLEAESFKGKVKLDNLEPEYFPDFYEPGRSDIDIEQICTDNPCRPKTKGLTVTGEDNEAIEKTEIYKSCAFSAGIEGISADCRPL